MHRVNELPSQDADRDRSRGRPGASRGDAPTGSPAVEPAAAPDDAVRARCRPCRIGHCSCRVLTLPILHPLPHIAMHVMQAPCIRLSFTDRMGLTTCILTIPGILLQLGRIIAKTIRRGRPSPRGILPLRLGRQTIRSPGSRSLSLATNSWASSHDTCSTGKSRFPVK